MIESLHERYHHQLAHLSDDVFLIQLINDIGEHCGWWHPDRPWTRLSGKFNPRQEVFATLVYHTTDTPQELCLIEVSSQSPQGDIPEQSCIFLDHVGWFRFTRFPEDPALPMLASVLTEGTLERVVQYLPHHRCTIQFRQIENEGPGFAKVFDSHIGRRIHSDGVALWQVALEGDLGFAVPRPTRWDDHTLTLWQMAVKGQSITIAQLFDSNGPTLAYTMGQAIASLHQSRLTPSILFDKETVLQQAKRHGTILVHREPHLRHEVHSILNQLENLHSRTLPQKLVPLHTDLHPVQWLEHETGLGLVDFDRLALGDPEYDVASFLTELEFKDKGRGRMIHVMDAFRRGHESVAPPLHDSLLHAYRAQKWLAKALRALGKIHIDGVLRATQCLEQAQQCLLEKASPC
ncbi:MAG: aminoglycoside phosphotransferase family protein [Nitrospirota bacterium]|nr:aminoglycoside phosphotransferase family protein [Nitrospirota bacterium]